MKIIKRIQDGSPYLYALVTVVALGILLPDVALTKPPTINITEPDPYSIVSEEITIKAIATDNTGVTQVEFFIDGSLRIVAVPETDDVWSCQWDTEDVSDGYHSIVARATDTSGKTAIDRVEVMVNNSSGDLAPVAVLDYSWDGYKYYFYPYECYDPDGYIVKYQYEILECIGSDCEEIDSYACCQHSSCNAPSNYDIASMCGVSECEAPASTSNFCLFFTCPYVCYEFAEPGTYKVQLKVWDNEATPSDTAEDFITISSSGSINHMYVWSILPTIKRTGSGTTLNLTVTVQHDSNSNGLSDQGDSPVSGVMVEMKLYKDGDSQPDGDFDGIDTGFDEPTHSGTTDREGKVIFSQRGLEHGDYRAEVIALTDPDGTYEWNPDLESGNPRDVTIWPLGRR